MRAKPEFTETEPPNWTYRNVRTAIWWFDIRHWLARQVSTVRGYVVTWYVRYSTVAATKESHHSFSADGLGLVHESLSAIISVACRRHSWSSVWVFVFHLYSPQRSLHLSRIIQRHKKQWRSKMQWLHPIPWLVSMNRWVLIVVFVLCTNWKNYLLDGRRDVEWNSLLTIFSRNYTYFLQDLDVLMEF